MVKLTLIGYDAANRSVSTMGNKVLNDMASANLFAAFIDNNANADEKFEIAASY